MKKWFILIFCILTLGCAGKHSASITHYLLPDKPLKQVAKQTGSVLIVNTDLSEYLNHTGLVYRLSDTEVFHAKRHLWAQDISKQLTLTIVKDLRAKQSNYWPIERNSALKLGNQNQLHIRMNKFNGVYTGNAEIAGEWLLIDKDGQITINETFFIEVPLQEEGYESLIRSLSLGLAKLTDEVAKKL